MRLRVLLIALAVVIISIAVQYWAMRPAAWSLPRSNELSVSFIGYTNGLAMIEVTNRARYAIDLDHGLAIYTRHDSDDRNGRFRGCHVFTNALPLLPGTAVRACFPAPTSRLQWRVEVVCVGDREKKFKNALNPYLPPKYALRLQFRGATTEWIAP